MSPSLLPAVAVPAALALIGLLCLGFGIALRARGLAAEAAHHRDAAERRDRMLGLLFQDLQAHGLALLGLTGRLEAAQAEPLAAEARRILRLADDLADWRAAEAGPRTLRTGPLPVKPLIEETVAAIAGQLAPGTRRWRIAEGFEGLTLQADRRILGGALRHVLARMARLTREGGWIGIRLVQAPDTLAIVIEDDGAGLGAEDLAPGGPEAVAALERTRGLGFGLATARSLLEAHGGELRLEAAPGIGARAWLVLPREGGLAAA